MKNKSGLAVDFIVLSAVKVVTAGSGMLTTAILSRRYSLAQYGTYSQALMMVAMASALILFALMDATNYFFNRFNDQSKRRRYINTIFFLETIMGLVLALFIILFQKTIVGYYDNQALMPLIYIIAISPLLTNYIALYQVLHVSIGNAQAISVRNFIWALLKLGLALILTPVDNSVFWLLLALLLVDIFSVLYYWTAFAKMSFSVHPFRIDRSCVKPIIHFAAPLAVYTVSKSLAREISKLFVSRYMGVEALAIFTNAAKPLPFDLVLSSMITIIMPYFTRYANLKDKSSIKNLLRLYFEIGYMSMWIMAGCSLIMPREIISFLYGDKYLPGTGAFVVYIIYDIVQFANISLILSARGKTKTLIWIALALLGSTLVLTYALTLWLGLLGASFATLLSSLLTLSFLLSQSLREIDARLWDVFEIRTLLVFLAKAALLSTFTVVIARLVGRYVNSTVLHLLIVYPMFVFASVVLNYKTLVSRMKELNQLRFHLNDEEFE